MAEEDSETRLKILEAARKDAEKALRFWNRFYEKVQEYYVMEFARLYSEAREVIGTTILRTKEMSEEIKKGEE